MSLWSKIKGIWEITGQIDKEDIEDIEDIDDIKGNAGKIETTAKNLKPGEDFEVSYTSSGFVKKVNNINENKAREAAAAKAKGRTTKPKVLGDA